MRALDHPIHFHTPSPGPRVLFLLSLWPYTYITLRTIILWCCSA
jgi:hypothetical protein